MPEVFVEYSTPLRDADGHIYLARACGEEMPDGMWNGWIEFRPTAKPDVPFTTGRETTQPNRTDTAYWAAGLTPVYLEGALTRALELRANA